MQSRYLYKKIAIIALTALALLGFVLAQPTSAKPLYSITEISVPGATITGANDINNKGEVLGYAIAQGDTVSHAILYSNGTIKDLASLGVHWLNDSAQMVGESDNSQGKFEHAILYNNKGQVVGYSRNVRGGSDHPFLYSDGKMTDLNNLIPANSNCELINALSINDAGQIVANGLIKPNDEFRAFLLTPVAAH